MKIFTAFFAVLALSFSACETFDLSSTDLSLKQVNQNPAQYRGRLVKVCGMATNQFENVRITEHRETKWRETAYGLGVNWLEDEPRTQGPEKRCIIGKIVPLGGWDLYDARAAGESDDVIITNGHSYDWEITQYSRKSD